MRILWASNGPLTPTGYGVQTAQVISRLKRDGHAVAVAANHGINGFTLGWNDIPVRSPGLDAYGQDVLPPLYEWWKAEGKGEPTVIITLYDVWVYKEPAFDALPIASWVPVDHDPVSPDVLTFARKHRMIAMSRFGQRMLGNAGVQAAYVPHAVETSVFHPVETQARKALNIPESAFVVTINAANKGNMPPRKGWNEMLTAWGIFAKRHPDAYLYLHTDLIGHNGVPLPVLLNLRAAKDGLPLDRVRHVPQPAYRMGDVTPPMLNELYSMSDVLLSTSYGEGFGVPVIEAQAAGVPVIVSDATAQPELCGAGWIVQTQPYYDLTQGADYGIPIIDDIVVNLEYAYESKGDRWLRDKAVAFAAEYDAETVYQRDWKPVLADLEKFVGGTPTTRQQRRASARKGRKAA